MPGPTLSPIARSLSPLEAEVVLSCYQHRLLTTTQIHDLHRPGGARRPIQRLLAGLATRGYVASVAGRPPGRERIWFASPLGAESAEASGAVTPRAYRVTPELAAGPLQAHTLAVNDVGIALVAAARAANDEFGPLDWDHEVAHRVHGRVGASATLCSDAVVHYTMRSTEEETVLLRFLELDRATTGPHQLAVKLRAYADLYRYRLPPGRSGTAEEGWRRRYLSFPKVMVVLCGQPEHLLWRRIRTVAELCRVEAVVARLGDELGIAFTTLDRLQSEGPRAPVFLRPAQPKTLVDLAGRQ